MVTRQRKTDHVNVVNETEENEQEMILMDLRFFFSLSHYGFAESLRFRWVITVSLSHYGFAETLRFRWVITVQNSLKASVFGYLFMTGKDIVSELT